MAEDAKRVSSTEAELDIKLEWKTIEAKYNEELDKVCKKATLPGFRVGKAPKALVEQKLGDGFLQEVAGNAMDDALKGALDKVSEKLKPLPYSNTVLKDEDKIFPIKKNKDLTFTVKYEIMPEFEVKNYKGINVEYPNVKISQDMIEGQIKQLQEQNAIVKDKKDSPIKSGDIVNCDYSVEGVKDSKRDGYVFTVGTHSSYFDFDDEIIGAKKGETKTITKTYKKDDKPMGFDGDKAVITVKVNSVKSKELPKVDDEFAEDVNQKYKTVKDLKDGIKKDLESHLDEHLKETKISLLIDKILESVKLDIPNCMVDFEVANTFRKFASQMGMSEADAIKMLESSGQKLNDFTAPWRKDAEHTIKSQLVVTKVRDTEKLEASDKEVQDELDKQFKDEKDNANKDLYKDMVKDNLAYSKAIDFLLKENKFTPSKKEISYEDFASGAYLQKEEKEDKKTTKKAEDKKSEVKGE